jgi:hypothetical protein
MGTGRKVLLILLLAGMVASLLWVQHVKRQTIHLLGAVITRDTDPRKELPIASVQITAADGSTIIHDASDSSGAFTILLHRRLLQGRRVVMLHFRHPDYQPLDLIVEVSGNITVAALSPVERAKPVEDSAPAHTIGNVVIRYSIKTHTEVDVGSTVRSFEVVNKGNVHCGEQPLCSPDGKWKAASDSITLDAGPNNAFRNGRASCIAGPCPFTMINTAALEHPGRTVVVSATVWSDTATFLVEAEVVHPMISDVVRNSYPVIFGNALNFTLPPSAEGVSIQAEADGQSIFFPLGPSLVLSWANCNARSNSDQTHVYRCELKPGYRWLKTGS